jgi:hypothetical protein
MRTQIIIEDHVVPQLLTTAIEAYEFKHQTHSKGRAQIKLETFGLLWGYSLPERKNKPAQLVGVMSTVETSALRHGDWVKPNEGSILMKRDFFREHWPHLDLIGTFHSHPYEKLAEVNKTRGWQASPSDKDDYWPEFHKTVCPDMDLLAHLVVTITSLNRKGTASPRRLAGGESTSGYELTAGKRKLWVKGYYTEAVTIHNQLANNLNQGVSVGYKTRENDILLMIPSIEQRFNHVSLRT